VSEILDTSAPRLRVGFLIDRWDPQRGGAERAMAQLAEHLLRRGHRVLAFACEHAADAPGEHVRVSTWGITRSARERRLARNLVAAAREHDVDVTIGARHLYEVDLYWPHGGAHRVTLDALVRAGLMRQSHDLRGRHKAFVELERELLERGGARTVACVSQLVFDELAREYPACRERLVLVENGVDLRKFNPSLRATVGAALRKELELPEGVPLIAFAARNPVLKGSSSLVGAMLAISSSMAPAEWRDLDWRLLIAGDDPERWPFRDQMDEFAARTRWRKHVDPVALWSAADLCVLPSWRDTSGLVILEALACGTPVITTTSAGAHDVVAPDTGTVIIAGRSADLCTSIVAWLTRIRAGEIDRAAIAASVAHRDSQTWLARLEALVVDLAATKNSR
jgi:UDP-glucose:(heptosyl)LPS alpha-1,3-glucosyltransferase